MKIGIVDVGIGNLGSLRHAVHSLGWDTLSVSTHNDFDDISHLLLPGVGAFASVINRLEETGLRGPISRFVASGRPLMGICLGMQILADTGEEGGFSTGLALIPGKVVPISLQTGLRIPHVGWNESLQVREHPLLKGIRKDVDFYFVHSYRFIAVDQDTVLAETVHGERFPSIIAKGNVVGIQFHPEKSQGNGLRLIDNFCLWNGKC